MFKVGDKVRRVSGRSFGNQIGYEGVISRIDGTWLHFPDGTRGMSHRFELVAPTGPVVTETVTKTRIVPGVYGSVTVLSDINGDSVQVLLSNGADLKTWYTADELDAAAAVLSALAKGLRDA